MKFIVTSARIEGPTTNKGDFAFLDTVSECGGFVIGVGGYPVCCKLFLCEKEGRIYLLAAPDDRWEQDIKDSGYSILKVI